MPIVAVDAWVKAGTRREKQPGVAHYLEHVLFTGTSTRPSEEQIDGAIEDLGGSLDGATSYDWAHFFTVLPSAGFDTAVGVLADVLQHATLTSAAVEDERPIIQSEIARADGDPETVLANEARTMIYGPDTAYGRAVTGTAADVKDITRDEIAEFYKPYYVPNNITLVVAGDVTVDEVKASAERYFSRMEALRVAAPGCCSCWAAMASAPAGGSARREPVLSCHGVPCTGRQRSTRCLGYGCAVDIVGTGAKQSPGSRLAHQPASGELD